MLAVCVSTPFDGAFRLGVLDARAYKWILRFRVPEKSPAYIFIFACIFQLMVVKVSFSPVGDTLSFSTCDAISDESR